jgi:hypothetical protein
MSTVHPLRRKRLTRFVCIVVTKSNHYTMAQIKPAPLIWINAFPGTGKFTIASILAHKLMEGWCTLVHNHDLIDAVTCPRDHPDYRRLRREERSKAFAQHVLAADILEKCVVFTGM